MQQQATNEHEPSVKILFRWLCRVQDDGVLHIKQVSPTRYESGWQAVDVELHTQILNRKSLVFRMPVYSQVLGKKDIMEEAKDKDEHSAVDESMKFISALLGRGRPIVEDLPEAQPC